MYSVNKSFLPTVTFKNFKSSSLKSPHQKLCMAISHVKPDVKKKYVHGRNLKFLIKLLEKISLGSFFFFFFYIVNGDSLVAQMVKSLPAIGKP